MPQELYQLRWRDRRIVAIAILLATIPCAPRALAVTQLKRGVDAPAIALQDQAGHEVSNAALRDHVAILIFGELYNDKTREACVVVDAVLQDTRLVGTSITPILVVTQEPGAAAPDFEHLPVTIARDPERKTFGAYQVAVMPSIVIIDRQGHVVHAIAGMIPRLADLLTDSLLYASGKLNADTLDRSLTSQATTQTSDEDLRAERIAMLARQLMRRGLDELAAEKYEEALKLNSKLPSAHLDLGTLLLKHQRLAEAEKQFRTVLAADKDSLQANLGLAFVQTMRGGSELDEAEKTVRALLVRSPSQPRALYLLGLIQERRGKPEDAAASFKKSSELLLERAEPE